MKILIAGIEGSGKTTQASILAQNLGLCLVKTGDLVRAKAKENSKLGESLRQALERGEFVNNQVVAGLVWEKLSQGHCGENFIMDGYPRIMEQLRVFDPEFDKVFSLNISDQEATERLLARGREDDKREVIAERIKLYHQETEQVLDYYRKQGKLIEVNGSQSIKAVTKEIEDYLKNG